MFPHICTIKTKTAGTAGSLGGNVPTYSTGTITDCEFWFDKGGYLVKTGISGESVKSIPMVKLPPTLTLNPGSDRLVTTQAGWTGTYEIDKVDPSPGLFGSIDHWECQIRKVAA